MQNGKVNILLDLQWGSSGKGKFSPWLYERFGLSHVSCSHRPNAGHTVEINGDRHVLKCLPSPVVLGPANVYLSAGAAFVPSRLERELSAFKPSSVHIHPRAMHVQPHHIEEEQALGRIASTMQGAGACLIAKVRRELEFTTNYPADQWLDQIHEATTQTLLHEASQGWELSLDHGHVYPHVTSRNCSTAAALDELGLSPRLLGDVYGIFRPYPIRVGDFEGNTSGPTPGKEISWHDVFERCGAPPAVRDAHVEKYEYTTVTKRRRRVFELDIPSLARACRSNGVTKLIMNFAQYIDWDYCERRGKWLVLPEKLRTLTNEVETACGVSVVAFGTGPDHTDVVSYL